MGRFLCSSLPLSTLLHYPCLVFFFLLYHWQLDNQAMKTSSMLMCVYFVYVCACALEWTNFLNFFMKGVSISRCKNCSWQFFLLLIDSNWWFCHKTVVLFVTKKKNILISYCSSANSLIIIYDVRVRWQFEFNVSYKCGPNRQRSFPNWRLKRF